MILGVSSAPGAMEKNPPSGIEARTVGPETRVVSKPAVIGRMLLKPGTFSIELPPLVSTIRPARTRPAPTGEAMVCSGAAGGGAALRGMSGPCPGAPGHDAEAAGQRGFLVTGRRASPAGRSMVRRHPVRRDVFPIELENGGEVFRRLLAVDQQACIAV